MHDRLGVDPYIIQRGRASTRLDTELLASSTANLGDELGTLVYDEPVLHWPVRFRAGPPSIMIARSCRSMRSPAAA